MSRNKNIPVDPMDTRTHAFKPDYLLHPNQSRQDRGDNSPSDPIYDRDGPAFRQHHSSPQSAIPLMEKPELVQRAASASETTMSHSIHGSGLQHQHQQKQQSGSSTRYLAQNLPIGYERRLNDFQERTRHHQQYTSPRNMLSSDSSFQTNFATMSIADVNDPPVHPRQNAPSYAKHASSSTIPIPTLTTKRPLTERSAAIPKAAVSAHSYHPKLPEKHSEFSMWVGNLPRGAPQEEIWRFFSGGASEQPPSPPVSSHDFIPKHGILSIFLISKTNCAFIDFVSAEKRDEAVLEFDGKPLRANDPRCPRLICRARKKEDELTAGVGAQRRSGFHRRWVEEHATGKIPDAVPNPAIDTLSHGAPASSGDKSEASTTSSFLAQNFPARYFILKALIQSDLEQSVETGTWRTQHHNEDVLEQAYRTSKDVFLIFSVNKSGQFFGYGRMSGSIPKTESPIEEPVSLHSPSELSDETPHDKLGRPFPIQWINIKPVSFFRTRHLRNPWNRGREIKISRDGVELEIDLGKAFLQQYEALANMPDTKKHTPPPIQHSPSN